jgi:drug/metabolite transporter (DMT)-like permease
MSEHLKGLLITLAGVICIIPDSIMARLIEADPMTISFWRASLTGSVTGLGVLIFMGTGAFRKVIALGPRAWIFGLANGISGPLFVSAVNHTSVANVVIIVAALPIFTALMAWASLGERISRRMGATIAAVAVGLAIVAYGSGETEGAHWQGDALALMAALTYAVGLTQARHLRASTLLPAIPLGHLATALGLIAFAAPLSVPATSYTYVLLHGGVFIVGSSVLISMGPRYLPPAEVALLLLLESALAPFLAWAVLDEPPGIYTVMGGAIILGALLVSNLIALKRHKRVPPDEMPPALH